jgi:hypothetical protein
MAGRKKAPVGVPSTALVASAVRYEGKLARVYQPNQDWQREAYRHVGICGEARFAAEFFGHALARSTLYVGVREPNGKVTQTESGPAVDALNDLFTGATGQAQMLEAMGFHLTVAGECYLVGRTVREEEEGVEVGGEVWEVIAVTEMKVVGNRWSIVQDGTSMHKIDLADDDVVIRIWRPKPDKRIEADSPFRSLIPVLNEIEAITRHIWSQLISRLAGGGILFVPQGMTFPAPPPVEGETVAPEGNEAENFIRVLGENMITPIKNPGSAAGLVPIVASVPEGTSDQVNHVTFWSPLDEKAIEMRRDAIHRFGVGMDLPVEQIEGMSSNPGTGGGNSNGVSHWGAWQIEESTIKMHVEPLLGLICNAITIGYLRTQDGLEDTEEIIWYSTIDLRLRPDRSKEALELYNMGLLSEVALMREVGFNATDLPDDDERRSWLLRKIATGSATPEQVQAALAILGVVLPVTDPGDTPRETRPDPSLEDHPTRPRTPGESALFAASQALVLRALERAGNRLRQKGKPPGCPAHETHCLIKGSEPDYLLEDAWSTASIVLGGIGDPDLIVPVLDAYCRSLLATQVKHTPTALREWFAAGALV